MSLERFINSELILNLNNPASGQLFTDDDLRILDDLTLIPHDPNIISNQRSEVHIYSFYGDYILGDHNAGYVTFEKNTNSFLLDVGTVFKTANIQRGSYRIVINLFKDIWGSFESPKVIVNEISSDRTEIKFIVDKKVQSELESFKTIVNSLSQNNILNNLVVNFGFNRIQKITNIKFDKNQDGVFYVKLYQPIFDEIENKDWAWFEFEVIDPYIDSILLSTPISLGQTNQIKGPNFDLDTTIYNSNSTIFKSWDDLLDSDLPTSQQIIDKTLSGSGVARLNIDYTDFENFIFYSSAKERVENFYYKVQRVESYSSSIAILLESTASNTSFISGSIDVNRKRIDQITTTFDPWEKWLYYEPTSSIFSHDITGSITPYPKRLVNSQWVNYHSTSSIVVNWYSALKELATTYDQTNMNRLYWSVPEHIYMDPGSSEFVTFVDMVGQHFDVLYSYIKALTKVHERDEHPDRGVSNDLLYYVAKSFGWQLQNTRSTGDLWKYKAGVNQAGLIENTGSLFSLSQENQTHQIWRRIVNNLPYLLKTKGTQRSVKALMSIYGIPQTLISIKEYGGPNVELDRPNLIEDRFYYKLRVSGSQYIEMPRRKISNTSGSWGGVDRVPDSIEFRFNTEYSSSISMSLWAIEDGSNRNRILSNLEVVHTRAFQTSSYSGSWAYGYLRFTQAQLSGSTYISSSVNSGYLPLFDDDIWSVKIHTTESIVNSGNIFITVGKVNDNIFGRISHTSSLVWSGSHNVAACWNTSSLNYIVFGGTTGSNSSRLIGNVQGYKEYFEVINGSTFDSHILNPSAYHGNNPTSSYYTLFRYYPLGLDTQRWDHSVYTSVSSSQPNRIASFDTTASFKNFGLLGGQTSQYNSERETFYIYVPSLGGNVLRSEKIRLEDSNLIRDLSPIGRSEKSAFDKSGFDSNRLAIVFSPTDQINNDIFNHTGYFELDDYIGDPEYEFTSGYPELDRFNFNYFRKYQQRPDLNAFIRIFSVYDYTFFEQIKQLVPGRADLVAGVLIESDVLHRSKVQLSKRSTIENPQYEQIIAGLIPTQSGEYNYYETVIPASQSIEVRYNYYTGSIKDPLIVSGSSLYHIGTGSLQSTVDLVEKRYSGSQAPTQSIIENPRPNCCYQKVIYHYSASGTFATEYLRQWHTAVSMSYKMYYSRSLECTSYQNLEICSVQNNSRFGGSKLEGPGFNIDSDQTIDKGPVVSWWLTYDNILIVNDNPLGGNLKVE